jgi:hypothetical protein
VASASRPLFHLQAVPLTGVALLIWKYSLITWFNSLHDFISVVQKLVSHWQQSQNVKMQKTTA